MKRNYLTEALEIAKSMIPGWAYAKLSQATKPVVVIGKAKWTAAYINDLPDSAFLYIAPGGEKDEDGKTTPRSLRHLPIMDSTGSVDMPHLRNALARIPQSDIPVAARERARSKAQSMLERENKSLMQWSGPKDARVLFIGSSPGEEEFASGEPFSGPNAELFEKSYLKPLGLCRDCVAMAYIVPTVLKNEDGRVRQPTEDEMFPNRKQLVEKIEKSEGISVICLGHSTFKAILPNRDKTWVEEDGIFVLPHPAAVRVYGDRGELSRKIKKIKKYLDSGTHCALELNKRHNSEMQDSEKAAQEFADDNSEESTESEFLVKVSKQAPLKRIVYGVVLDPYGTDGPKEDAHGDWNPPAEIEKTAHDFLKSKNTKIRIQHMADADAHVVESSIVEYPSREEYLKAMNNEPHSVLRRKFGDDVLHSGSWVLGVELGQAEWKAYENGVINAFSPGGIGRKVNMTKSEMPAIKFVDLVESEK